MMSEFLATRWLMALLEVTARTLVLFTAAGMAVLLLRRASAASRHLVWLLTMAGLLFLPLLSAALPGWRVALWPAGLPVLANGSLFPVPSSGAREPIGRATKVQDVTPRPVPSHQAATSFAGPVGVRGRALALSSPLEKSAGWVKAEASFRTPKGPDRAGRARGGVASGATRTGPAPDVQHPASASLIAWMFLIWLAIGAAVLARAMAGLAQLWRIGRRCRQVTAAPVLSLAADLGRELGVTRPVLLLHGLLDGPPAMPMTWGFRRPVVLLPTGFAGWPEHRQRAVLLHELAHVKRGDWLAQMLAQVTCAVYWFHPLAWWAARRLRVESERACDDRVLTAGVRPSDYATQLLEVVRTMKVTRVSLRAAVTMAHRPLIEERLRAILDARRSRGTLPGRACVLAVAGAAALLLPLAAIRVAAKKPSPRALPAARQVSTLPPSAANGARTVASVEITPRGEPSAASPTSLAIRLARQVSAELPAVGESSEFEQSSSPPPAAPAVPAAPAAPAPPAAPAVPAAPAPPAAPAAPAVPAAPAPHAARRVPRVDESSAAAALIVYSPAAHAAADRKEECRRQVRAQRTVLAFGAEIHPTVVLASTEATGGDVFTAEATDEDRPEAKSKEPNLADKDLSGADLSGRDLSGKDLSGKDLSGANLTGARLRDANLSKTDLSGANLTNADLSHAKVKGADLSGVNLTGANLSGLDLSGVDLSGANLSKVNSSDLTLVHADLSGANLKGINLSGRDLSGADFSGADLSGARLSDANLTKADLSGANLGDADLSHARLKDADLSGANLNGTNVRDADLSGADVSGTKLDKSKSE